MIESAVRVRIGLRSILAIAVAITAVPVSASNEDDMWWYFQSAQVSGKQAIAAIEAARNLPTLEQQCAQLRKARILLDETWHTFDHISEVPGAYKSPNVDTYYKFSESLDNLDHELNKMLKEQCDPIGA